jgi:hypothetical protein
MDWTNRAARLLLITASAAALTACGGAPSESDIKDALQKQTDQALKKMGSLAKMAGVDDTKIQDVEKIGCDADGDNAYRCDVKVTVTVSGREATETSRPRFVKTSNGWVASR